MRKAAGTTLAIVLFLALAAPVWPQEARNLWVAKFTCQPKAAAAVASVQQSDAAALQYSSLFKNVTTFATNANQPAGTWSLSADETSFAGGSAAKRVLVGLGTGRAHVEMQYQLRDPQGNVVWTKKVKSEPSLWGSSGSLGAVQNQDSAMSKQSEKLIDELTKFFDGKQ